jgi:hypothetical protein
VLSADKDKGFIGDVVTVTGTMDEGWYLTGFNSTGATMTGNKFAFAGEDVTVEGLYTDEGFPVVYEAENGVHLTGDTQIAIPGQGVTLTTSYDTYYRTNGYDITGGYIENGMLYATAACTARLKSKLNAFTATGGWEKGSDVEALAAHSTVKKTLQKFAIHGAHTGDVPASWYSTSNRWKPSNASAYSITLHPVVQLSSCENSNYTQMATIVTIAGTTTYDKQNYTMKGDGKKSYTYNKTRTVSTQANYSFSAFLQASNTSYYLKTGVRYVAAGTTGTWTATGIAP